MKTRTRKKGNRKVKFNPKFKAEYRVTTCWNYIGEYTAWFPCRNLKHAKEIKRHFDKSTPHLKDEHFILKITTTIIQ